MSAHPHSISHTFDPSFFQRPRAFGRGGGADACAGLLPEPRANQVYTVILSAHVCVHFTRIKNPVCALSNINTEGWVEYQRNVFSFFIISVVPINTIFISISFSLVMVLPIHPPTHPHTHTLTFDPPIRELCDEVAHETRGGGHSQHHGEDDGDAAHSISFEQV